MGPDSFYGQTCYYSICGVPYLKCKSSKSLSWTQIHYLHSGTSSLLDRSEIRIRARKEGIDILSGFDFRYGPHRQNPKNSPTLGPKPRGSGLNCDIFIQLIIHEILNEGWIDCSCQLGTLNTTRVKGRVVLCFMGNMPSPDLQFQKARDVEHVERWRLCSHLLPVHHTHRTIMRQYFKQFTGLRGWNSDFRLYWDYEVNRMAPLIILLVYGY